MTKRMSSQRGAALLIVLMLVAAVAVIALAIVSRTERATQQIIASKARDQAYWALIGAERAALVVLETQNKIRPGIDTPEEPWLATPRTIPFEYGMMTVAFRDASVCFNIHDVIISSGDSLETDEEAIKRFGRLLSDLGGDANSGELLAYAVADFIDSDQTPGLGGGEDFNYTRGDAPYLTAGTWLADVSEVRAVTGWTAQLTEGLSPWMCARSQEGDFGKMNLNTMTVADAPLLANALDNRIPVGEAERLIDNRPPDGYAAVQDFMDLPNFASLNPPLGTAMADRLGTEATRIEFTSIARYGDLSFELTSVIEKRTGSGYKVVSRRFGPEG